MLEKQLLGQTVATTVPFPDRYAEELLSSDQMLTLIFSVRPPATILRETRQEYAYHSNQAEHCPPEIPIPSTSSESETAAQTLEQIALGGRQQYEGVGINSEGIPTGPSRPMLVSCMIRKSTKVFPLSKYPTPDMIGHTIL